MVAAVAWWQWQWLGGGGGGGSSGGGGGGDNYVTRTRRKWRRERISACEACWDDKYQKK